ncbi:nitroreductase family protein [bacterium]|nr:nitroreductase family protein [bacterium]
MGESKRASNQFPISEGLQTRWSPRSFSDRPVEKNKLQSLLEAARWAPSCFNAQPWSFIVATKEQPEAYQRLLACLLEGNQAWAKSAPVLVITAAKRHFEHNGNPNRYAWHDVGLAVGALLTEATAQGLFVHQMAGFDTDKTRATCHIPETHEPVTAMAIGYLGDPKVLPESLYGMETALRIRNPLESFVFEGLWGQPASLLKK